MTRATSPKALAELKRYNAKLESQGGVCAICGNPPKTRRLHWDHDHKTGVWRDLLCYRCNRHLVGFHTLATARKIVAYLEKHSDA